MCSQPGPIEHSQQLTDCPGRQRGSALARAGEISKAVDAVTGLVGAAGGLGGFFPPLAMGALKRTTGEYAWGFLFLGLFDVVSLSVIPAESGGSMSGAA